jgi:hypothetical protein
VTKTSGWKNRLTEIKASYRSDTQDTILRILNAVGTAGFGYEAGKDLFGFLFTGPNALLFASITGAVFVACVLDVQYLLWSQRTTLSGTSTEQRRIAKSSRSVSMWASAILTFSYFLLRFVSWLTNDPAQAENIALMITRLLAIGTTAVLIFQFWKNDQFLQNDPENQRLQAENDIEADRLDMELDLRIETETIRQEAYAKEYRAEMKRIGEAQGKQDADKLRGEMNNRLTKATPPPADTQRPLTIGDVDKMAGDALDGLSKDENFVFIRPESAPNGQQVPSHNGTSGD